MSGSSVTNSPSYSQQRSYSSYQHHSVSSSQNHPPILYDTSTSSATESLSTASTGRYKTNSTTTATRRNRQSTSAQQHSHHHYPRMDQAQYGSDYDHQQQPDNREQQYERHSPQQVQAAPDVLNMSEETISMSNAIMSNVDQSSRRSFGGGPRSSSNFPTRTRSEPGGPNIEHARFSAHVNRFDILEERRKNPAKAKSIDPLVPPMPSRVSERIRRLNSQGQNSSSDLRRQSYSSEHRRSPSPSPRQSAAVQESQQQPQPKPYQSRSRSRNRSPTSHSTSRTVASTNSEAISNSKHQSLTPQSPSRRTSTRLPQSEFFEKRTRESSLGPSPRSSHRETRESAHDQGHLRASSVPPKQVVSSNPIPPENVLATPTRAPKPQSVLNLSIETPPPATVRKLKQQLWNNDEMLQVAVPPTLHYVGDDEGEADDCHESVPRRKSYYQPTAPEMAGRRGQRPSRSLSPGRHTFDSGDDETPSPSPSNNAQRFKSKFYEAAIAARLRGKVAASPSTATSRQDSARVNNSECEVRVQPHDDRGSRPPINMSTSDLSGRRPFDETSIRTPSPNEYGRKTNHELSQHSAHTNRPPESMTGRRSLGSRNDVEKPGVRAKSVGPSRGRYREMISQGGGSDRGASVDRASARRDASEDRSKAAVYSTRGTPLSKPPSPHRNYSGHENMPPTGRPPHDNFQRSSSWHAAHSKGHIASPGGRDKARDFSTVRATGDKVSSLLEKLHAVNRDDPEAALAAIDSILKDESKSSSKDGAVSSQPTKNKAGQALPRVDTVPNPADDEDGSSGSDDDTTVSSITNPSYQSSRSAREEVRVLLSNPFEHVDAFGPPFNAPKAAASNPSAPAPTPVPMISNMNPFGPSTASFRRPRPSSLNHYSSQPSNGGAPPDPHRGQLPQHHQQPPNKLKQSKDSISPAQYTDKAGTVARGGRPRNSEQHNPFEENSIVDSSANEFPPPKSAAQARAQAKAHSEAQAHAHAQAQLQAQVREQEEAYARAQLQAQEDDAYAHAQLQAQVRDQEQASVRAQLQAQEQADAQAQTRITSQQAPKSSNPFDDSVDMFAEGPKRGIIDIPTANSKLDSFMNNPDALAEQIRTWDEMSTGASITICQDSGIVEGPPPTRPSQPSSKDRSGQVQQTRWDNSRLPPKPQPSPSMNASSKITSADRRHPWDNTVPRRQQQQQHINIKDTSMDDGDGIETALNAAYDSGRTTDPDIIQKPTASKPVENGWDVTPRITPQQQEKHRGLADSFDADWVSLTQVAGFPEVPSEPTQARQTKTSSKENKKSSSRPKTPPELSNADVDDGVEVSLLEEEAAAARNAKMQTSSKQKQKEPSKRKGFLRAFKRKDKKSSSQPSTPERDSRAPPVSNRAQPLLPMRQLPNFDAKEVEPPSSRGRNSKKNSGRSSSMERFRSAKLGRVLRLYGNDQ